MNSIEVFRDDNYENCIEVKQHTCATVYLMSSNSNADISLSEIQKVSDCLEIDKLINKYGNNICWEKK